MIERTAIYEAADALYEVVSVIPSNYRECVDRFGYIRVAIHIETIDRLIDSLIKIHADMPSKSELNYE